MDTRPAEHDLEARKKVRVRLRPNLIVTAQHQAGQTWHVVKDPVSLGYFRLDDRQRYLVGLMDGSRTLDDIQRLFEDRFRPDRLTLEELEHFTAQLLNSGLAQNESPQAGRLLFERSEKQRRAVRQAAFLNFLNIKIPLFDPDALLTRLLPRVGFLFTFGFLLVACGIVLAALGLLVTHWDEFLARLPSYREFFSWQTILWLWLALGLVKIVHELGHGLCCKAHGGEVHEMGFQLLIYFPALYCDVSDSWMLPRKWQRIAISLAGIYVELLVAAVATFTWWATDPASVLHHLCLGLMIVCGVNTVVFNANPLMRFDGYHALSDWLEVPNLSSQATRIVQAGAMRWLGMNTADDGLPASTPRGFLTLYAIASYIYRWIVLAGTFWLLHGFLEPRRLGAVWFALILASLGVMVGWPAFRLVRAIHRQGRLPDMKPVRLWISAGIVAAAVAVIALVPFPVKVQGIALLQVEPEHVQRVAVGEVGGFLQELLVRDGQRVHAGDVVAVLTNPELEIRIRVNEADQALRVQQQSALVAQSADTAPTESRLAGGLQQTEFELMTLRRQESSPPSGEQRVAI